MKLSIASCCFRSRKDLFLTVLSAILLALSFPRFNLEFLAWFAFIPLFFAAENASLRKAFFLFFICGLVFWAVTIWWLIHVTLPGTIFLILYLALFFGIFGFILNAVRRTQYAVRLFFIPAIWVLLEYARGHLLTGFPWALLGYSQYLNLPFIQIADIFGAWGVSFAVMMVNAAVYSVIGCWLSGLGKIKGNGGARCLISGKKTIAYEVIKIALLPVLVILCILSYGFYKLNRMPITGAREPVKVSVIQGNIARDLEWFAASHEDIVNKYRLLSLLALKEKPDLIVWPEAALPGILEEESVNLEKVRELSMQSGVPFLFGSVTNRGDAYYNSALLVSGKGEVAGWYDKLHLVPFGEYIPLRNIFPFLQSIVPIGDETPGSEYTVFSIGQGLRPKFSVLICFEDVFPELSRQFRKKGAQILINITNDSWFKDTFAPYQHFQASVFRAVENRIYILRSANTGISGFISPEGKIISLVKDDFGREVFVDGYKTEKIFVGQEAQSFYTRFGDLAIISLCALITLITLVTLKRK
ncbi:MAG: apolipoprotein N-acyltransferase [Candidatus Omnitrophota bacterium]